MASPYRAPKVEYSHRDLDTLIAEVFGTTVAGLVFCTLAWAIGQQFF